jgi:hypothetical protein
MGLGRWLRGRAIVGAAVWVAAVGFAAGAQTSITLTEPPAPLLPQGFGGWKMATAAGASPAGAISLSSVSKAALEECGPERSQVADYQRDGRALHIEAIQFGDRTGAFSAFTLVEQPGMQEGHDLGADDAVGTNDVLFTVGSTVVMVSGATIGDAAALKPLVQLMPKISGNKAVSPLLPSLLPTTGLVNGSLKYALGASTYAAEGGVLPANSLGWDKSAEAVTAHYADKRGQETLTLLLYPTPQIAGNYAKAIQSAVPQMGPQFASAKVRREAELVILAEGSFSPDQTQKMVENVNLRQQVSFDKDMGGKGRSQAAQTYSLLANITILSVALMAAAVLLGLFLGGGRALLRVMRGKSAAVEPEFLSLHLAPQNKAPEFRPGDSSDQL